MNEAKIIPLQTASNLHRGTTHVFVRDYSEDMEVVHVFGDMDLACADELESLLVGLASQKHEPAVVVNLTACHYLDSTILTVFVRASKALGPRFALVVPSASAVRRIFQIVGLDRVLQIMKCVDEASTSLGVALPRT